MRSAIGGLLECGAVPDLRVASKRWPAGGSQGAPAAGATVTIADSTFDPSPAPVAPGQAFDTPGTYDYFCAIHSSMTGTIEVTA